MNETENILKWYRTEAGKDLLKVLSGIRGSGKTHVVRLLIDDLRRKGVKEKNIVHLDFESPLMRQVKTYDDVLNIIRSRKAEGRLYLFLDEITGLLDFEVLMGFLFGFKEFDVLVATSNRRLFTEEVSKYFEGRTTEYHLSAPLVPDREPQELERVWGTMFLRDVLGGHSLADATAEERLAELFSDRLGEMMSFRKIAQTLVIDSHRLHPNTIQTYTQALEEAYLIEAAPVYDVFERYIMKTGCRYFWTDPEVRENRFGPAPTFDAERRAYNQKYLELRNAWGTVYCARSNETFADFVVFDRDGEPETIPWKSC